MKKLTFLLLLIFFLYSEEKPFVVVIPSYNNALFYEKNLDSVLNQNYQNYRVIYIDDASTDGMGSLVKEYLKNHKLSHQVTFIRNSTRKGALANKYKGAWLADPKEIIVDLDGDDWLAHDNVLAHLNMIYADPNVWVTYGQFSYYPCGSPGWADRVPIHIIEHNQFRDYPWVTTALRTFYAGLFQKINKEDLLLDGNFFPMASDLAFMFPICEMAGFHSRFIPETLYVYNVTTTINDGVLDPDYQLRLGWLIRERKKYQPITSPY